MKWMGRVTVSRMVSGAFLLALLISLWPLITVPGLAAIGQDLKGEITLEQLYVNAPLFERNAEQYSPAAGAIDRIGSIDRDISIVVFLGTWCHDSQDEVPKLLKVLETANNPHIDLELHAADFAMQDGAGFAAQYGVRRVPTIIFKQGGKELGRIVEHPDRTMEESFLEITKAVQQEETTRPVNGRAVDSSRSPQRR